MKLIFISLLVVSLAAYIHGRSVSQIGDIRVVQDGDKWICGRTKCPLNSERCFISRSNRKNPSVLIRVNICYSEDNKILKRKTWKSKINPSRDINEVYNSYRNRNTIESGGNNIYINGNDFDGNEFNKSMNNLNSDLRNMQENIQRGIQQQQRDLAESLNQMNYNLAHMFG